jgi:hypothetical protein
MSRDHMIISPVYSSEPDLLTNAQKFSGGFICNVHPDNLDLMQQAAKELNFIISEGAPRKPAGTENYLGIYADIATIDPQALLQKFFTLLVARSTERAAVKGASHVAKKSTPKRRRQARKRS